MWQGFGLAEQGGADQAVQARFFHAHVRPEGLAVGNGGHFYVADEYGPSLYEFTSSGHFIRAFAVPANLTPVTGTGARGLPEHRFAG